MRLRTARPSDAPAIVRMNVLLAEESEAVRLSPPTVLRGVRALLADRRKGFYILAEEGGEVLGQVLITHEWSDWRARDVWWVQSVFVREDRRRGGVFKALLAEIRRRARRAGVKTLRLYAHRSNGRALEAYRRTGWTRKPFVLCETDSRGRRR